MQELASDEKCHLNFFLNASDDYLVFGEKFIITKAHSKLAAWLGCSVDNITGRSLFDFVHHNDKAKIDKFVNEAISYQRFCQFECRFFHRDGDFLIIDCKFIRTENNLNVLSLRNLTDEKKHLQKSDYRHQHMHNLGMLCAGVVHDLNNALGSVILSAQLLHEENEQENLKPFISIVTKNTDRARDMIKRILGLYKKQSAEQERFYIDDVIDETFELISLTFPKHIELKLNKRKAKLSVLGDSNLILQSILNLCLNAKEALLGSGRIEIELDTVDPTTVPLLKPHRSYCKVSIKDTGVGIPLEHHDKIFTPFFSTKKNMNGSGLGLTNCQAIIHEHQGVLVFDSKPNRGSIFSFFLPLCKEAGLYKN